MHMPRLHICKIVTLPHDNMHVSKFNRPQKPSQLPLRLNTCFRSQQAHGAWWSGAPPIMHTVRGVSCIGPPASVKNMSNFAEYFAASIIEFTTTADAPEQLTALLSGCCADRPPPSLPWRPHLPTQIATMCPQTARLLSGWHTPMHALLIGRKHVTTTRNKTE